MEWKMEMHDDLVIISTFRLSHGSYSWGSIHIDALFGSRNEDWYQELVENGEVFVEITGERL